jgi:hypothetical protein
MIRGKVNTPSIRREHHEEREAPPLHRIKMRATADSLPHVNVRAC